MFKDWTFQSTRGGGGGRIRQKAGLVNEESEMLINASIDVEVDMNDGS